MWGIAMSGSDVCGFWDNQKYAHSGDANAQLSDHDYQQLCNRCAEHAQALGAAGVLPAVDD
jgi:hypothetical protein